MALVARRDVGDGFIALWRVEESVEELLGLARLTEVETSHYRRLTTERRQREWLAWHVMARRFIEGASTDYSPGGMPVLTGKAGHISVSHGGGMVALYYCEKRCGIDMESLSRDFGKAAQRVVSHGEQKFAQDNEGACLVWCAKEAAFKYAEREGVDFKRDLVVTALDTTEKRVRIGLFGEYSLDLGYETVEGCLVVYTLCRDDSACPKPSAKTTH